MVCYISFGDVLVKKDYDSKTGVQLALEHGKYSRVELLLQEYDAST